MADNNYTLGRGKIYFDKFLPGTTTPSGSERYLGNTPDFSLTFASSKLDHFSSDRGIKEKDASVILEVNRTGKLVTDNINPENIALFFFGTTDALAVIQATVANEPVGPADVGVELGMFYQLGQTDSNPGGARNIIYPGSGGTAFTLKKGMTTLVRNTDYALDTALGRIEVLTTGTTVDDGDELTANYTVAASSRTRVISGSASIEGQLRFIAANPKGTDYDYLLPYVTLSPDGDYSLKGGDEWQAISFGIEVLKRGTLEALYMDGRAV